MKPFKVYTSDLLIRDVIAASDENPKIAALVQEFGLRPGSKHTIIKETHLKKFLEAFQVEKREKIPGGSASNTMVTLGRMLKQAISTVFFGLTGTTDGDEKIRHGLETANITLVPPQSSISSDPPPESALSFVITFPDGERSISTWPGNAKEKLKSGMIDSKQVATCDAVFVQLGLKQKMQETPPAENGHAHEDHLGIADKLLKLRWGNQQDLWLAMPTQADFTTKERSHASKVKLFQQLTESANVILSNGEELARVFTDSDDSQDIDQILRDKGVLTEHFENKELFKKAVQGLIKEEEFSNAELKKYDFLNRTITADFALQRLQKELDKKLLANKNADWHGNPRQVAFITLGEKGAAIVTPSEISEVPIKIPVVPVRDEDKKGTLGCGDTAYAGFLASYVKQGLYDKDLNVKMTNQELRDAYLEAGQTGVTLAAAKLEEEKGPRLPHPMESLRRKNPKLAENLGQKNWRSALDNGSFALTL